MDEKLTTNNHPKNMTLEVLRHHFPECFDKNGDFDLEKFRRELSVKEVDFSKESYALEWLGKSYARLLATNETETLLQEDKAFNAREENTASRNLLIKGDNLDVLKHLVNAYREQVKMIYIDPPYNTGSDGFVYKDDRRFSVSELSHLAGIDDERAKRILDFVQSGSSSHSAWLTFMYPRLYIARHLLREDGVIFVSIDDNEVAQLRLLMDEIFGEENYIKELVINTSEGGGQAKYVVNGHEYLFVYAKNLSHFDNLKRPKDIRGKKITIDGVIYWIQEDAIRKEFGKYGNLHYEEILEYKDQSFKDKVDQGIKNNEYILIPKDYGMHIIGKLRKISDDFSKFHSILNIDQISKHLTKDGIKEIESIFSVAKGNSPFSNPKPLELLKRVVQSATFKENNNDLILDFFAGSGTTGDAVMQLNAEDDGNRRYILVQLPEPIDPKKNKTAYEFVKNELRVDKPTIFDITRERLIRAARKIRDKHPESEFDGGFKIFETMPIPEGYRAAIEAPSEEATLFDPESLNDQQIQALLLTWKTYDGVPLDIEPAAVDLGGYTAYLAGSKLYLMGAGFTTEHLKALLEKMDEDADFTPNAMIAFGYRFESKMLRELAENLKAYDYKKGGGDSIEFVTRY